MKQRRAVSEILVTLLLVAITIIGGLIAWSMVSGEGNIMQDISQADLEKPKKFQGGIVISGYDTRDGDDVGGLTDLDNTVENDEKCKPQTIGQIDNPPNIRRLVGDDHIVLTVINNSPNIVILNDFQVNEISHIHDGDGSLDAGTFIVLANDATNTNNPLTNSLNSGVTVKVAIKLSDDFDNAPIKLLDTICRPNKTIRIGIDASGFEIQNFVIKAGAVT